MRSLEQRRAELLKVIGDIEEVAYRKGWNDARAAAAASQISILHGALDYNDPRYTGCAVVDYSLIKTITIGGKG